MPDDYSANRGNAGTVAVGGTATGEIEASRDRDWFAVEFVAGRTYVIDIEGADTGDGTLTNPLLRGLYDSGGDRIDGTRNDNAGTGRNASLTFTATETDTYYIEARGHRMKTGTYTVQVSDATPNLGDITDQQAAQSEAGSLDGSTDAVSYWRFTLTGEKTVALGLSGQDADADLVLEDAAGNVLYSSRESGTDDEQMSATLAAGTYYVRVEAQEAGANAFQLNYEVTATPEDLESRGLSSADDDYSEAAAQAGSVEVGSTATGSIEMVGDRDWFAVTLEAGKAYVIEVEGAPTSQGTLLDPKVHQVYGADGNVADGDWSDDDALSYFWPAETGTYYFAVGSWEDLTDPADMVGTYRLSVAEVEDDFLADVSTSGTVAVGGSVTGEIDFPDDRDWFAVTLEAGGRYRLELEGRDTGQGTLPDPYLRGVYDSSGNLIPDTSSDDGGTRWNSEVEFVAEDAGTYYIAAGAHYSSGSQTVGTYRLSVSEIVDDYSADADTTGTVAVNGNVAGEVGEAGDHDWFAVELVAGKTYRIDLEGADTGQGTLEDPFLRGIYHVDSGSQIATYIDFTVDDDSGVDRNAETTFGPAETGTYYIAASGYGASVGTYRVSVTEMQDDYAAYTGTSGTVAVEGSATGEINFTGDRDWFAVTLEAEASYRIKLEGSDTGQGTLADPFIYGVYDADGNRIGSTHNNDGGAGRNSKLDFQATEAGTYYIAASAYGTSVGTYQVSVAEIKDDSPAADYSADTGTAGTITVGGSVASEIDTGGDRDWFAVTLEAGTSYRIDLEGAPTGQGTLADPYLRGVYDANGNLIPNTGDDDGGTGYNSQLDFQATEAGTYYISAGAFGSREGTYQLSIAEIEEGM